jgi:hypothetical protein
MKRVPQSWRRGRREAGIKKPGSASIQNGHPRPGKVHSFAMSLSKWLNNKIAHLSVNLPVKGMKSSEKF